MSDLSRLTKAELIKLVDEKVLLLKESETEKKELEEKIEANKDQIEADLSFSRTPTEAEEHIKKQREKDFIKKMTHGRYTSKEKYEEFLAEQNKMMRQGIR